MAIIPQSTTVDYISTKSLLESSKGDFIPQFNLHKILIHVHQSNIYINYMLRMVNHYYMVNTYRIICFCLTYFIPRIVCSIVHCLKSYCLYGLFISTMHILSVQYILLLYVMKFLVAYLHVTCCMQIKSNEYSQGMLYMV